jgi:pilus assembly protein Flp/PilA
MFLKAIVALQTFRKEEDGLALTEYLVLLGLLVGGVIVAVGVLGTNLSTAWTEWSTYFTGVNDLGVPGVGGEGE